LGFDGVDYRPELRLAKIWPAWDDLVEFAQEHGMDHETLVGFTKVLYNVHGPPHWRCRTSPSELPERKSGFERSANLDRSWARV
jgi:hypothetical protein